MVFNYLRYLTCEVADAKVTLPCRIQLGQPATVKVAANLIRLLAYQNKVCSVAFQVPAQTFKHTLLSSLISTWCRNLMLNSC
jgi:hypothetical protein